MDMINIPAIDIIMQSIGSADAREPGDASDVVNEIASTSFLDVMSVEPIPAKGANDSSDMTVLAVDVPKVTMPDTKAAKPASGFGVAIQQPEIVQHEAGEIPPAPDIKQPDLWTASVTAAVAYQNSTPPLADKNTALPVRQAGGIAARPIATPIGSDRSTIPVEADLAPDSKTQTVPVQQIQAQPRSAKNPTASTLAASQPADKAAIIPPTARTEMKTADYPPVKGEPAIITPPTGPSSLPVLEMTHPPATADTPEPSSPKPIGVSEPSLVSTTPPATEWQGGDLVDGRDAQIIRGEFSGAKKLVSTGTHVLAIAHDSPVPAPLDTTAKVKTNQQGTQIPVTTDNPPLQATVSFSQPIPAAPEYSLGNTQSYTRYVTPSGHMRTPAQTDLPQTKTLLMQPRNLNLTVSPANQPPLVQSMVSSTAPQLTEVMPAPRPEMGQTAQAAPNTSMPAPLPEQVQPVQISPDIAIPEPIAGADDILPLMTDIRQTDALISRLDTLTPRPEVARHIAQQLANVAQQMPDRPIELTLNPEELGRVRLTFTVSDGAISVAVLAERGETMDLMRRHIETLAQEFRNQGYKDVNFEFSRGGQQGNAGSGEGANADGGPTTNVFADSDIPPPIKLSLEPATGLDLRL